MPRKIEIKDLDTTTIATLSAIIAEDGDPASGDATALATLCALKLARTWDGDTHEPTLAGRILAQRGSVMVP